MDTQKKRMLILNLLLGSIALVAALSLLAVKGAQAQSATRYVANSGNDTGNCRNPGSPCRSVQFAVDQAAPGDQVNVAAGTYSGVNGRGGLSQVLYVDQPVSIRGGYDPTNWAAAPDPIAHPTTLDAGGQGRGIYIAAAGLAAPPGITIEGLRVTGGNATGLGGHGGDPNEDGGGGIYVDGGRPAIRDCVIHDNVASAAAIAPTGGDRAEHLALLPRKRSEDNAARSEWYGRGGGIYLRQSAARLTGNTVEQNRASSAQAGLGGGIYLWESEATLAENTIRDNSASTAGEGLGGGVYLWESPATLVDNIIERNIGSTMDRGGGGGLRLYESDATIRGNDINDNVGSTTSWGYGGGVFDYRSNPALIANRVQGNVASNSWYGLGGGLYLLHTAAHLEGNLISSNTATLNADAVGEGGGLWLGYTPNFTLTNNVIADNTATLSGSGLWLGGASWSQTSGRLVHNTFANNRGCGQGLYVDAYASVDLINTIVSGHSAVGVKVAAGGAATLASTLWNDNLAATGGEGLVSSTDDYSGDPAFVGPMAWDFHLTEVSAAIDMGSDAGVLFDIDGHARDDFPDIGADEYVTTLLYLPVVARSRH